ncbi:N-acetylmuramoyl-L-alanine amidase [Desulfobacter curvatus]|uniref:N-acetylmuramoyl-L-alanine amidase n=1 Tax=Desulfobacter curvatus TaxID=2290 RepID=UPI00037BB790|nr:peptidoglycan recognition family protein [Desulfobacter curvatus]
MNIEPCENFSFLKGSALVRFFAPILAVILLATAQGQAAQTYSCSELVRFQNRIIDYRSRINPRFKKRVRPKTRLIIVHTSELGLKSTLRVVSKGKRFKNGRSTPGGHANYVVARNGTVYRILDKKYRADHAGLSMWNGVSDISDISVGIEFVGYHYAPLTTSQYTSAGMLLSILKRVYGLQDKDILTHSQIAYGKPNRWFSKNHRGRKRCAKNFDRMRAGLGLGWPFDPDVRAGLLTPDSMLAQVFYPDPGAVVYTGKQAPQDLAPDVISKQNSAWAIAGEDYDAPDTVYVLPGGKTLAGDRVASNWGWNRLPAGTKVLLNQETEQVREQAKSIIKTISGQMTAWSHAGGAFHAASTIYFLPSGRILSGRVISDWDDLPSGTRLVVGYKGPFNLTKYKTAYGIAGAKFKDPGTIYHIPGRGPVPGNRVPDFSNLPKGTGIYLPIAG